MQPLLVELRAHRGRLSFGPLLSTKMACHPGMELEGRYFEALGKVDAWRIEDGELVLRGAGAALRLHAAP